MMSARCCKANGGFSLLELLIVIAIMGILSVVALPAFRSIMLGTEVNRAGLMTADALSLARQEALTRNREVQVRFLQLTEGSDTRWAGIQVWRIDQTREGFATNPVGRVLKLPAGVVFGSNAATSPLLTAGGVSGSMNVPGYGSVSYRGFSIRPTGAPEANLSKTNNFITIRGINDSAEPPSNYFTVQVAPVTGKISTYRP